MKKFLLMALLLAPLSLFAQKFGHFNSADIIQLMPEYKTSQDELQKLQQQYETEIKAMQEELQRKSTEYEKDKATLPDNIRQRREQEMQDLYARIQQTSQDDQQALQKASGEKMQAIADKVKNAVKAIGDAGGYVYIMDLTAGIPYISTQLSIEVTAEIKAKLGLQ